MNLIVKNKDKYGIKKVTLTDNSEKYINTCKKKVFLSTHFFLLNADTWYGSKGFLPCKFDHESKDYMLDEKEIKIYQRNKFTLKSMYVKDIDWTKFIKDKQILKLCNDNKHQRLIGFLNYLNDKHECLFINIEDELFDALHFYDFHKRPFILFI